MPDPESAPKSPIKPKINPAYIAFPGFYSICSESLFYLSASGGGGKSDDTAIQTGIQWANGRLIGPFLQFTVWTDSAGHFAFQTSNGNFITAVNGGGLTANALITTATDITAWEEFQVEFVRKTFELVSLQTANKNYLTAVGLGRQLTNAIHSDAVTVGGWESFTFRKSGDLGTGFQYLIKNVNLGVVVYANNGGGETENTLYLFGNAVPPMAFAQFKLVQQPGGSYGIETINGHYLSAVNGGGLNEGTATSDNILTNATVAQSWEQFRFIDRGDSTYSIQTFDGNYIGQRYDNGPSSTGFSTAITDINDAFKFWLIPINI
jgi:hypothetical protein